MADLTFILTTAGFNALVNPANTGTNAITIDRIGVSSVVLPGSPESNIGLVQLPNELKRIASFGGDVVGDNTIHVTIRDESVDVYALRTFGLYSVGGVLLAFYTQPAPIMEKAASSMLLLAADLQFTTPISAELVFGDTTFINPPATTELQGVVELATAAETATGTDGTRAVTPFGLKSLLTSLLAGFSQIGHTHAAGDVISGTFAVARIPDLAQAKVIGLVDALAGKAAAAHTHAMSEVTGLVAALGLKLAVSDFTWQNLVGRPATLMFTDAVQVVTARKMFVGGAVGGISGANYEVAPLEVRSTGNANAAFQSFHIPGLLAEVLGLDVDGDWKVTRAGGTHRIWTTYNFDPASKAPAVHTHPWGQVTGKPNLMETDVPAVVSAGHRFTSLGLTLSSHQYRELLGNAVYVHYFPAGHVGPITSSHHRVATGDGGYRELVFSGDGGFSWAGAPVWTVANFDPASKAAAVHSHDWNSITSKPDLVDVASAQTVNGFKRFKSATGGSMAAGATGGCEVQGQPSGAALLAFHIPGVSYSVMGLDTDLQWKVAVDGGTPSKIWHDANMLDTACPAGVVHYLAATSVPSGMRALVANGAAVSRTTYARLFAAIGTVYGAGDGGSTFNMPDLRGVFVRGLDNGRGIDSGRGLNSLQMSQNLSHTHGIPARSSTGSNNGYVEDGDSDGIVRSTFTFYEGGSEARPTNEALLAVITY
jgi:microcystin-dependent protein